MSWLRLNGKVVFENNMNIKERIFEKSPLVKGIYKNPNNPSFEVFYLKDINASISENGKLTKIY